MMNVLLFASLFYCDIKGEVKKPGVYEFSEARISDIIELAGGISKNGDISKINLSKKVTDEMVIYVPNKKEKSSALICECPLITPHCKEEKPTTTNINTTQTLTTTLILPTSTTKKDAKININTASISDLLTLKGIGNASANKILEYRQLKPFTQIEDLLNVKGIGDATFAQIKDFITV